MLLLSCSGLSRGFDEGPLFQDIAFELQAGERVGLSDMPSEAVRGNAKLRKLSGMLVVLAVSDYS
jgi:hypothetical protein